MEEKDWEDECLQLTAQLQRLEQAHRDLATAHLALSGRYQIAERTHAWAYSKWWCRLFLPLVLTEGRELMRCRTCGRLYWSDQAAAHIGHYCSLVTDGSWWEFVQAKLGWL